jgi:hypothetical protein
MSKDTKDKENGSVLWRKQEKLAMKQMQFKG